MEVSEATGLSEIDSKMAVDAVFDRYHKRAEGRQTGEGIWIWNLLCKEDQGVEHGTFKMSIER